MPYIYIVFLFEILLGSGWSLMLIFHFIVLLLLSSIFYSVFFFSHPKTFSQSYPLTLV